MSTRPKKVTKAILRAPRGSGVFGAPDMNAGYAGMGMDDIIGMQAAQQEQAAQQAAQQPPKKKKRGG